jgi:selenide,water dikinase
MLSSLHLSDGQNVGTTDGRIALDCSVRKTRHKSSRNGSPPIFSISTTDFFFPLVDSPYVQGRIGAANVLSDLYAEGVEHCDFVLMLLAACRDMPMDQRTICTQEMVRGFRDACTEAETSVSGGQTVLNPWPIIGGVATSIVTEDEFVPSDGSQVGNVMVLTKPLGTQVAVNIHQWKNEPNQSNRHWTKCKDEGVLTDEQAEDMMHTAVCSMARLNRNGGRLMLKYKANACTDVTGFGILGHAQNLSENQKAEVGFELHTLPLIAGSKAVDEQVFNFRLTVGYSAETSGGLLVSLPADQAEGYIQELEELDGTESWIIGRVVADPTRKSKITEDCQFLEV